MRNAQRMRGLVIAVLFAPGAVACTDPIAAPEATARPEVSAASHGRPNRSDFGPHLGTVIDCDDPTAALEDPATLLCRLLPPPPPDEPVPVVDTRGRHLTLGEWSRVKGELSVKCLEHGTLYRFELRNLVPRGVYTAWNFIFVGGVQVAAGPLGASDGSQNMFRASRHGKGHLSLLVQEGTAFPSGFEVPDCGDLSAVSVIAAYHMDGMTYGPMPGPANTQAFHAVSTVTLDQGDRRSRSDVLTFEGEHVVGTSTLTRHNNKASVRLSTSGLEPGSVATLWFVVFNKPDECSDDECGEDDLFNSAVMTDVLYGTGRVIGHSGRATFAASRHEGDNSGSLFGALGVDAPGVIDARSAEIHLVVRSHGPKIPGLVGNMRSTFNGGCMHPGEGFPPADEWLPELGTLGPNVCADVQFSVHK